MATAISPLTLAIFSLLATVSVAQLSCTSQTFVGNSFALCSDLPSLNSFLFWNYDSARSTLSVAFVAPPPRPEGWISWAINPTGGGMDGAHALVAFRNSSGGMAVRSYDIVGYSLGTGPSTWFQVRSATAEFSGGVMRLFATLVLPANANTTMNHIWQVGSSVSGGVPSPHATQPANLNARGRLDLLRGQTTTAVSGGNSRLTNRNIHGILNVVSWGLLFPIGILFARYLRVFPSADPTWFYLHVSCQISAYAIGVAGWATGMRLGSESSGITYSVHRNIGITLFTLATLQVFALFLRPKKDHKHRFYWNIYHHGVGYSIAILGIYNVFRGLAILQPAASLRNAYIAVISVIGGMALLLEVATWIVVLRRKKSASSTKPYNGHTGQQHLAA